MAITEEERIGVEESIFIETKKEAIRATQEWTLDRLMEWDNDLRPVVCKTLIESVSTFGVEVPDLWYDMILNPATYNEMHDDEFDVDDEAEPGEEEEDFLLRPTEAAEREILESVA